MNQAGFPKGVVNLISNAPSDAAKVVASLIAHPAVKRVNFTGSSKVGKTHRQALRRAPETRAARTRRQGAARSCWRTPISTPRSTRPSSGPSPTRARSACRPSGSSSTSRWLTPSSPSSPSAPRRCPAAIPAAMSCWAPSSISAAAERMDELIADAKAKGAVVVAGGKRNGAIVEATIIDRVTPRMRIYHEESFGPVKPVVRVNGDEEAIRRRQRHRIRPFRRRLQPRRPARLRRRQTDRIGHLPHQRADRARRRRRCRSAASSRPATGASAARR